MTNYTPEGENSPESESNKLDFFYQRVIVEKGESLVSPEEAEETFDMELWFGSELDDETKTNIREKLGVDLDKEPEAEVTDQEGNMQMTGWKTSNSNWTLFRWDREDGTQILALEETMLDDFFESQGFEVNFKENPSID